MRKKYTRNKKIIHQIEEWTRTKNRKCLVIQGARKVGKTFAVEHFAQNYYEELVEINCKQTPSATEIFSGDLSVENMVMALRFRFPNRKNHSGNSTDFSR